MPAAAEQGTKMSDVDVPEGWKGHLSSEQTEKLKQIWKKLLELADNKDAGVEADENADEDVGEDDDADGEDAMKGKAKDDAGKDAQAKEREQKELKAALGKYGADALHKELWQSARGEDPDALMLRFLRARKWDVDRAFAMCLAATKWRIENNVQEIKEKGELGLLEEEGFKLQYDLGKSYIHGTDRQDRPLVFVHVARHKPKDQSQKSLRRYVIFSMEASRAMLTPKALGTGCLVFDMTNFGLSNMDWSCIRFILECFEARYPESLGQCLVHNAPMVFNAVWAILKPLLDPVVRSKVAFTNSTADLEKYIDPKHLGRDIGGGDSWRWSFTGAKEGENDIMQNKEEREAKLKLYNDAAAEFESVTRKWVDGDESAAKDRDRLAQVLLVRHLDLDPYVRGQTVYTRNGVIVGDGRVHWKYNSGEEWFGESANELRDELGISGECPNYGGNAAEGIEAEANAIDPDKVYDEVAGIAGGSSVTRSKRKASNAASKITPGPSKADKARDQAIEDKERLLADAKAVREKAEAEEREAQEEADKREQKKAEEEKANSGILASAMGGAAAALNKTVELAKPAAHAASAVVPTAVGGQRLADATAPASAEEE